MGLSGPAGELVTVLGGRREGQKREKDYGKEIQERRVGEVER